MKGATGVLSALALGAANTKLFINAAGTAPEFAAGIRVGSISKDTADVTADQSFTGFGFKPSSLIAFTCGSSVNVFCVGMAGPSVSGYSITDYGAEIANRYNNDSVNFVYVEQGGSKTYQGKIKTWDADGITITWTRTGAPTGSIVVYYIAFR